MEVSCSSRSSKCISLPIRSPPHPLSMVSTISFSVNRNSNVGYSFRLFRRKTRFSIRVSSTDTLLAGSREVVTKKEEEFDDLKSWMHKNGLTHCKVVLKEKHSHDEKHRHIHYVAASEDLQAGDVMVLVPNSLAVTLERVLGNETIAELLTTNKLSKLACLALYLVYEKKQGKKSFWFPYIRELDC